MLLLSAWYITVLSAVFLLVSLLMMLIILIQKPKGGGLSGAFGGAGGGSAQAAFGAKVGDVLTYATVVLFILFLFTAMGLTWTINPEQERLKQGRATATAAGALQDAPIEAATEDAAADGGVTLDEAVDAATPAITDPGPAAIEGEAEAVEPPADAGTPGDADAAP